MYREAVKTLTKAVSIDPQNIKAQICIANSYSSSDTSNNTRYCDVFGEWNGDVFVCTKASHYRLRTESDDNYKFIPINNTKEYTPTGDYNPATKKYVDDSVEPLNGYVITYDNYATEATLTAVDTAYQKYLNGQQYAIYIKGKNSSNELLARAYFIKMGSLGANTARLVTSLYTNQVASGPYKTYYQVYMDYRLENGVIVSNNGSIAETSIKMPYSGQIATTADINTAINNANTVDNISNNVNENLTTNTSNCGCRSSPLV
jgi:hypothetical protein